jgi:vacuolar-type H+-ATPase subunit I/STV1
MKNIPNILFAVLILGIVGMLAAACATPPTEDMNKAVDAVTRAENDADAVAYADKTLIRARDALEQMKVEADVKRYDQAKNYATEAITAAEKAISDGRAGAARAREEAARLLNTIKPEIDETESSLSTARQVPNLDLNFNNLDRDLASAKSAYANAENSLNTGNYKDVAPQTQPIRPLLSGIRSQITNAATIVARKK